MSELLVPHEPEQNPALVELLNLAAWAVYGTTRQAAHQRNECIRCHRVITPDEFAGWSPASQREYGISGLCESCWDALFPPEEPHASC